MEQREQQAQRLRGIKAAAPFRGGLYVMGPGQSPVCGQRDESIYGEVGLGCTVLGRVVFWCQLYAAVIWKETTVGVKEGRLGFDCLGLYPSSVLPSRVASAHC